jgi:hypothetical protein
VLSVCWTVVGCVLGVGWVCVWCIECDLLCMFSYV